MMPGGNAMNLLSAHRAVSVLLAQLDFSALFPGFHPFRFALYDEQNACVDGSMRPRDERFRGNTAIDLDGEWLAIWNLSDDPADPVTLAHDMAHEMFHCFQLERGETRYPDDLALLAYPDDTVHFARKHHENCLLADAFERRDSDALRQFCAVRNARLAHYPEAVRQECLAETIEGAAEYVGLKALQTFSPAQYERAVAACLRRLREDVPLLFDVRRGSYDTGAFFCLTLDALGFPVHNDFSAQTLYEQNALSAAPDGDCPDFPSLAQAHQAWTARKRQAVDACMRSAVFTSCPAHITGYDPMNMQRLGDLLLCTHFVCVHDGRITRTLSGPVVLRLAPGENDEIVGYYAALP